MMRPLENIETIGLCGAGQMGLGVAVAFKRGGYCALVFDVDDTKLETLVEFANALEEWMDENAGLPTRRGGSVVPVRDLGQIDEQGEVIVECITEDFDQKASLFASLHKCKDKRALFLTTTSGLSITELGSRGGCGSQLVGAHFWNPAHLMPLVEITPGRETAREFVEAASDLVRSIGKTVVEVHQDVPGFIGNRLLHALWREAIDIVERGIASPEDVDLVSRLTFGLRMPAIGPLENMDLVGLDLVAKVQEKLLPDLSGVRSSSTYLGDLVKDGCVGIRSGRGFFDWKTRNSDELVHRRDAQIVHQMRANAEGMR